jgi:Chromate transporter
MRVSITLGLIGLAAFGGPAAHVALMRRELVQRRGWVNASEFSRMFAACNLVPGPSSTELAILLGYRLSRPSYMPKRESGKVRAGYSSSWPGGVDQGGHVLHRRAAEWTPGNGRLRWSGPRHPGNSGYGPGGVPGVVSRRLDACVPGAGPGPGSLPTVDRRDFESGEAWRALRQVTTNLDFDATSAPAWR